MEFTGTPAKILALKGQLAAPKISVNDGATFTKDEIVSVAVESKETTEMVIGQDPSCKGDYSAQKDKSPLQLASLNQNNVVYGKFRALDGRETGCVQASIVHDSLAPAIRVVDKPQPQVAVKTAIVEFACEDAGSTVDFIECKNSSGSFDKCVFRQDLNNLGDGMHMIPARCVDRAGNKSNIENVEWLVDTTPPVVQILSGPPALTNLGSASFDFNGTDAGGSGVSKYTCEVLDGGVTILSDGACSSVKAVAGLGSTLAPKDYLFRVVAYDQVGNASLPALYNWRVDQVPSGDFSILGLTSAPTDVKEDDWLGGQIPTVSWTPSAGAANYLVSILTLGKSPFCAGLLTTNTQLTFSNTCTLVTNTQYYARVMATNVSGVTKTVDFLFTADMTPPQVVISQVLTNDDLKTADIRFSVADQAPGVLDTVNCYRFSPSSSALPSQQVDCRNLTTLSLASLQDVEHKFQIVAIDKAGNMGQAQRLFSIRTIVCDPFSESLNRCEGGWIGELLYTLNPAVQGNLSRGNDGSTYNFNYLATQPDTIRANALLRLNQLSVYTRPFDSGFPAGGNTVIRDTNGNTLYEYFGMRLNTIMKLDSQIGDAPGFYQIAILSDDGSNVYTRPSGATSGAYSRIVNNDGIHSTKLGCSTAALSLDGNSRVPLKVEYMQGPRIHIALTLLWRRVDSANAPLDTLCGFTSNTEWFGPVDAQDYQTNPSRNINVLFGRGWKVMAPTNFIKPVSNVVE